MKRKLLVVAMYFGLIMASNGVIAEILADYDQFCIAPIVEAQNPHGASAARDQFGNPVIYVDPEFMRHWAMSRIFVLAHECAHHMLGHTLPQGMWFRTNQVWATRQQELNADCWAAQQLSLLGDIEGLKKVIVQFSSQGSQPQGSHPSGAERAGTIANCAGIDLSDMHAQKVPYCCDTLGNRHCVIKVNPGPQGSMCGCAGKGYGVTCY